MKIAFFGSSLVSSYWNGAATYYRGLLKALATLGQEITFYEPDAFERQQHRDISDPDWARVVVYPATEDGWRRALQEAAHQADLIAKASGVGVFDEELDLAVAELARTGLMTVYWDVDAPATLESMSTDPFHHLHRTIPRYDLVLTYGGGDQVVERYRRFDARQCVPIYNAADPQTHHPAPRRNDYACDLSFLGNRLPDREARVDEFLLAPAQMLPGRKFLLGGAGWDDKPVPANVTIAGHVGSGDHNAFFCSGLATLNINRDSMAKIGFSPPTRIFEAAAAGACIITDAWDGIDDFLEPGTEILVAGNSRDVVELLEGLRPEQAKRIGEAARRRILDQHTYTRRAQQVMKVLNRAISSREAAE
ncbi:glycosyltransferase [Bradyrhizobium sp. WSM 1738]|uniref:CgeB family protein n=1 Tax=Bradyrhizobium hereditatis TaxID=2821405 RepID=UPI001CE2B16D|nr:glycosyltransferase [Bradyrhizobium hereditatis]MCA6119201.1 glycosyltransferase [Bradyrhizobium hereditatis]